MLRLFLFALALLTLAACNNNDDGDGGGPCGFNIDDETVFFEFQHQGSGDTFIAWTNDDDVIAEARDQLAQPEADRNLHISGNLGRWPSDCNALWEWSWYFIGGQWALAEVSIALCDGDPQFVSDNLDDFLDNTGGTYCPNSSRLLREVPSPF